MTTPRCPETIVEGLLENRSPPPPLITIGGFVRAHTPGSREGRRHAVRFPDGAPLARGRRGLRDHHDRPHRPRRQPPGNHPQQALHQQPLAPGAAAAIGFREHRRPAFAGTESGREGGGRFGGNGGGAVAGSRTAQPQAQAWFGRAPRCIEPVLLCDPVSFRLVLVLVCELTCVGVASAVILTLALLSAVHQSLVEIGVVIAPAGPWRSDDTRRGPWVSFLFFCESRSGLKGRAAGSPVRLEVKVGFSLLRSRLFSIVVVVV